MTFWFWLWMALMLAGLTVVVAVAPIACHCAEFRQYGRAVRYGILLVVVIVGQVLTTMRLL